MKSVYVLIPATILSMSACAPVKTPDPYKQDINKPSEYKSTRAAKENDLNLYLSNEERNLGGSNMRNSAITQNITMQSYRVKGKSYQPEAVEIHYISNGKATKYQNGIGIKTSSGESYNPNMHTAAHRTFPMNTMLLVKNLDTNRETIVRINDRGPFDDDFILELSDVAANDIGLNRVARVEFEVVGFDGSLDKNYKKRMAMKSGVKIPAPEPVAKKQDNNINEVVLDKPHTITSWNYSVQLGAFTNKENATRLLAQYGGYDPYFSRMQEIEKENGVIFYRVLVSGFQTIEEAKKFMSNHQDAFKGAVVVRY